MSVRRTLAPLLLIAAGVVLAGCPPAAFDYDERATPRIWVGHSPLNPDPGQPITVTATAEIGGAPLDEIYISAFLPGGVRGEATCSTNPCVLTATAGGAGAALYSARVRTSGAGEATSGGYGFHVGQPAPGDPIALRVPIDLLEGDQVGDVLLVADRTSYAGHLAARSDIESLLYDGLLADPAYRWRDRQLGFWLSRFEGTTSGYYSGLATRCGQEPWLGAPEGPTAATAAAFADVVGVIHRNDFRDCGGMGVVLTGASAKRNFSADGRDPWGFQHEFSHAFAGLSDEYTESSESRRSPGGSPPDPLECFCCPDGGTGVTDGPGTVTTGPGLTDLDPVGGGCLPGQPPCSTFVEPIECTPVEPACPPLGSSCEEPNIFPSEAECRAAATEIQTHPGVENPQPPGDCRLLCSNSGGDAAACPCTSAPGTQWWILDRRHPVVASLDDDVMGFITAAERHGPACQRCIETRFCLAWELARGRDLEQARGHCLDPEEAG